MQNFYDLTSEQKNYFLKEVFELAGRQTFTPTFMEVLEDTDRKAYVVAFLKKDVGGLHYVIEKNGVGYNTYTKEQANQVIAGNEFTKVMGGNEILPQNKFMEIKRVINNL